jgi:hypothetical protein
METLVAYTFAHDDPARAAAGRARVAAYYGDRWTHHGYDGQHVGLHLWDQDDDTCRWPAWDDTSDLRVASVHAPVGWQSPKPAQLAQAVRRTPASFLQLLPPFTMAVLDPAADQLDLFTDSLGVGDLYELQLPDGCVWTNRPVAALLFAGVPAAADSRGWTFAAACGWFMDDSTPYDGVLAVPGATHIVADGYRQLATSSSSPEEPTVTLEDVARSVATLWPGQLLVDESGSQEIAAAFHSVLSTRREDLTIDGLGSEVARGHYYPRDVLKLDELPLPDKLHAFGNHLVTRLIPRVGPTAAARRQVAEQIERVLQAAVDKGITNATMLDYFYLVEPLRRQELRPGTISPLLAPKFIQSALALQPAQRLADVLPVDRPSRPVKLADAVDGEQVEELLKDVEGFEPLGTLWAASVAGASSAAAEATLRRALRRATFDQHLAEVNQQLSK